MRSQRELEVCDLIIVFNVCFPFVAGELANMSYTHRHIVQGAHDANSSLICPIHDTRCACLLALSEPPGLQELGQTVVDSALCMSTTIVYGSLP